MHTCSKLLTAALTVPLLSNLVSVGGAHIATASTIEPSTYLVEFTNTTPAQYLTPPNFAAHDADVSVWRRGHPASPGVQAVAENGAVGALAAELKAALDDTGRGVSVVGSNAPIGPGETITFEITTSEPSFSLVSMIICTNDGFAGLDADTFPTGGGRTREYPIPAYDAGTEVNTERRSDIVPAPFCGDGPGAGESNPDLAENSVIRRHRTLRGVGDLAPALDWQGPVGHLTITKLIPEQPYTVIVENLTAGQWLTPPNFAAHDADVSVWRRGHPASPGVQAVAENGAVGVLAAELEAALDDTGRGVSGVGAGAPIPPGGSVTFEVTTDRRKLSIVSMIICTNDGFTGLDSRNLPRRPGDEDTFYVLGYDAGTEVNSERRADIVPAPFCGDGPGSGVSNPDLAEGGVIAKHTTLLGVGDLAASLDWSGPIAKITVINNG